MFDIRVSELLIIKYRWFYTPLTNIILFIPRYKMYKHTYYIIPVRIYNNIVYASFVVFRFCSET